VEMTPHVNRLKLKHGIKEAVHHYTIADRPEGGTQLELPLHSASLEQETHNGSETRDDLSQRSAEASFPFRAPREDVQPVPGRDSGSLVLGSEVRPVGRVEVAPGCPQDCALCSPGVYPQADPVAEHATYRGPESGRGDRVS
jgi:hypothetical protein